MFAAANIVIERTNTKNCLFLYVYLTSTNEENIKKIKAQINLAFLSFFRNFAGKIRIDDDTPLLVGSFTLPDILRY